MASQASSAAASVFSGATSSAKASPAHAAASAYVATKAAQKATYSFLSFASITGIVTILALVAAAVYFLGYGNDVTKQAAKAYRRGEAKAVATVQENTDAENVHGLVTGRSRLLLIPYFIANFTILLFSGIGCHLSG